MYSGLSGPNVHEVYAILDKAVTMSQEDANLLSRIWDSPSGESEDAYLDNCREVWNALEISGRFLPLGWFEATFADCPWASTTRALHAVADVVCATLVKDLIDVDTLDVMTAPWEVTFQVSFA